jgi:hypothetical protein
MIFYLPALIDRGLLSGTDVHQQQSHIEEGRSKHHA